MKKIFLFLIASSLLIFLILGISLTTSNNNEEEIVFIKSYENYAWVETHMYTFVTNKGMTYTVDNLPEILTEDFLKNVLENNKFEKTYSPLRINSFLKTLKRANIDNLEFNEKSVAMDAGQESIYYIDENYNRILLGSKGDIMIKPKNAIILKIAKYFLKSFKI